MAQTLLTVYTRVGSFGPIQIKWFINEGITSIIKEDRHNCSKEFKFH